MPFRHRSSPTNARRRRGKGNDDEIEESEEIDTSKGAHRRLDSNSLKYNVKERLRRYINVKFALPQGEDDFGVLRPPKWGKILTYHDGMWTVAYTHHVPEGDDDGQSASGKKNETVEMVNLTDVEFDKLVKSTGMKEIVRTNIRNQEIEGSISIDTRVVPKHRRQFVDLKFTIPYRMSHVRKDDNAPVADNRQFTFCMVTDFRACDLGKGETKDVWVVTYDNNTQHFMFLEDLLRLMSHEVAYDPKSMKMNFRNVLQRVVDHWFFDSFVMFFILGNCLILILEKEYDECDESVNDGCKESTADTWFYFDLVFTIVFTLEMLCKMIAHGLINKPKGYFRDNWNYLDFAIVLEGVIGLCISSDETGVIKSIRVLRILRPLRTITHLHGLREIVNSFIKSVPLLIDAMLICGFYFMIFGICGLSVFIGEYRKRCFDRETGSLVEDIEFTCGGGFECPSTAYCGSHIENPNRGVTSFDNFLVSFLTIFQAITLEGWVDIMYFGMDSVSIWTWIYYFFMILIGAFILINLTLAIILSKFNEGRSIVRREMKERSHEAWVKRILQRTAARNLYLQNDLFENDTSSKIEDDDEIKGEDDDEIKVDDDVKSPVADKNDKKRRSSSVTIWTDEMGRETNLEIPTFLLLKHPLLEKAVKSDFFEITMGVLIFANVIVMGMDHYPQSETYEDNLELVNAGLTIVFLVEMILKWIGLGLFVYFKDGMNRLDFVVVMIGVVELFFLGSTSSLVVLRAIRLGRLVKFVRFMGSLQDILKLLANSLSSIVYVSILLLLFIVIYSILGMQFFQHKLSDDEGNLPRNNFDSFHWAFVSIFQVLAGENWPALLYDGIAGTDWFTGSAFFVSWVIIGQFVLLNLFLAVVMANFDDLGAEKEKNDEKKDDKDKNTKNNEEEEEKTTKSNPPKETETIEEKILKTHVNGKHEKNLGFIKVGDPFHIRVLSLVASSIFRNTILTLIVLSSIALAMECPATMDSDHEDSTFDDNADNRWIDAMYSLDIFFCIVFGIEFVLKSMAFGFAMHPNAYIRNGWNVLDLIVVVASILNLCVDVEKISAFRVLRLMRVLRPLRVIQRNPGLRIVINALMTSFNALKDILLVLFFVWILFSMLGVQFFKGRLYTCSDPDYPADTSRYGVCALDPVDNVTCLTTTGGNMVYTTPPCDNSISTYYAYPSLALTNNTDSSGAQREWIRVMDMNFDNAYEGFLVLFVSASGEGWPDIMFATSDITGIDRTPKLNNSPHYAYFWVIYVTLVCFFFAELFVGAVFNKFVELKRNAESGRIANLFLTEWQQIWVKEQQKLMKMKPSKAKEISKFFENYLERIEDREVSNNTCFARFVLGLNLARKKCHSLIKSDMFEIFIMSCIVANTIIIAMPYYEMSANYESSLNTINYVLTVLFLVEMLVKHFALSIKGYWIDPWNQFDGILVLVSMIDLFIGTFPTSLFRVFRVGRVVGKLMRLGRAMRIGRFARAMQGLVKIMKTLWLSIPALVNVAGLLGLLFFIFAVLGVTLFGDLALEYPHSSFNNFPNALLTLFRISTGEDWQNLMYACYEGEYGQFVAALYFILFVFLAAFVVLNLFVAIIADNFEEQEEEEEDEEDIKEKEKELQKNDDDEKTTEENQAILTRDLTQRFKTAWATIDPDALHFIPKEKLRDVLVLMGPPAGLRANASTQEYERLVVRLQLKKFENHLNFTEVLVGLHRLMYKHIADSIPHNVQSDLSIDKKNVHSKVIQETLKRSVKEIKRQNSKRTRKKSDSKKISILKHVSEVAEHQKTSEDSRPKHWEHMESNLTFEIVVKRIQRRFRFHRAMKRIKRKGASGRLPEKEDDIEIFGSEDLKTESDDDDDNDKGVKIDFNIRAAESAMVEMVDLSRRRREQGDDEKKSSLDTSKN